VVNVTPTKPSGEMRAGDSAEMTPPRTINTYDCNLLPRVSPFQDQVLPPTDENAV